MVAKIIPAAILVAVIVALGQVFICQPGEKNPEQPASNKAAAERLKAKKSTWGGNAKRDYNLTFGLAPESLSIQNITFNGLNTKNRARVKVLIFAGSPQTGWSKEKQVGWGYRAGLQANIGAYRPKIIRSRSGAQSVVQLVYRNIPTAALGPLCGSSADNARYPLYIVFPGLPGGTRQLEVNAPAAPLGACLGRGVQADVSLNQRIKRQNNKVTVFGRVTGTSARRVVVQASNTRGFKSTARPRVNRQRFSVKFRPPKGKIEIKAGLRPGKWLDTITISGKGK